MSETLERKDILEDLMLDIEEEKCVLLIGPEIVKIEGKSQTRFVHEKVKEHEANYIDYYYQNDSLFLFKDEADKNRVARRLKRLYRSMEPQLEVYRQLLELPVPLIISLNPDTFLTDVARQLGLTHDFSHFRFSGSATDDVLAPTSKRPLFYNLCGCRTEEESLILDYEDLFRLLQAMLPDGLPNKIRMQLREASSFLFLGFDFEKWYSQLFLQLLTGERKGRPKFAIRTGLQDGSTKNFLLHQFQIKFLESEKNFLNVLHEALSKEGLLRKLSTTVKVDEVSIYETRDLIAKGLVDEALNKARTLPMKSRQHDMLIHLISRYNNWKKEKLSGTFQLGQAEPILNKITKDFLEFLNEMV